jgi:hypothetical protein
MSEFNDLGEGFSEDEQSIDEVEVKPLDTTENTVNEDIEEKVKPSSKGFKKDGTARKPYVFTEKRKQALERANASRVKKTSERSSKMLLVNKMVDSGAVIDKSELDTLMEQNRLLNKRLEVHT